jgi:hypothetical protein
MLDHPWLNQEDNYDYKHTDKEFEVMQLKKEIKEKMAGGNKRDISVEKPQDMGELVESD